MNKTYDIIFIYGFSRLHPYYLSVIKYLSSKNRIGICILDIEKFTTESGAKRINKLHDTEKEFIELCKDLGADIIYLNEGEKKYIANILFIPQAPFNKTGMDFINDSIKAEKIIGAQGFGYGEQLLDELFQIGCKKFLVYDKNIFSSVLQGQKRQDLLGKFEIIEMGASYLKYPIWNKNEIPEIDYLIALPTLLFLKNSQNKLNLVKNMYALFTKLKPEDRVAIKLHNVKDGGNRYIKEVNMRSKNLARFAEKFLGEKGVSLSTAIFYRNILDRAIPLISITSYYNFGLELFLPYVKKGVITGISTVIWHCLYNKIPVYNCDSQSFGEHLPNYDGYKNYYVPYCNNELKFDESYFNKISDSAREADLIEILKKELET